MKETPPNPSSQLKYSTTQIPGVHIKLFLIRTPLRRESQALFYRGCRNKSPIQKKITKGACDKGFQQQNFDLFKANLVNKINSFHSIHISSFNHPVEIICSCWLGSMMETSASFSL